MQFELYKGRDGWRWRLVAANGNIVADSAESYRRKKDCLTEIERIKLVAPRAEVHET